MDQSQIDPTRHSTQHNAENALQNGQPGPSLLGASGQTGAAAEVLWDSELENITRTDISDTPPVQQPPSRVLLGRSIMVGHAEAFHSSKSKESAAPESSAMQAVLSTIDLAAGSLSAAQEASAAEEGREARSKVDSRQHSEGARSRADSGRHSEGARSRRELFTDNETAGVDPAEAVSDDDAAEVGPEGANRDVPSPMLLPPQKMPLLLPRRKLWPMPRSHEKLVRRPAQLHD